MPKTRTVFNYNNNDDDDDNDKRLGLTAKADQPLDHKKIQYTKNKNGQRNSAKVTNELSQNVK